MPVTTRQGRIIEADTYNELLDEYDARLRLWREAARGTLDGPQVGDYVRFACGETRRISYRWSREVIQTSKAGSFYLDGNGWGDFSGSLYSGVPEDSLTDTGERRQARFWFFSHNYVTAHNGIDCDIDVRVWDCDREAPRC